MKTPSFFRVIRVIRGQFFLAFLVSLSLAGLLYAANEITITYALTLANGDLDSLTIPTRTLQVNQNTVVPVRIGGIQDIGTTEEEVDVTGMTTNGWSVFRNRDATNFVTMGVKPASTYYPMIRLKAGEAAIMRLEPAVAIYAKADTAAVKLEKNVLDD